MFPNGSSVLRRSPWLLTGSLGSVRLLSGATMGSLRLPLLVSARSLRLRSDTLRCLALSLAPAAKRLPVRQDVVRPVSPLLWLSAQGSRRISQVPREPLHPFALLSDPGRISAPGICFGASMLPHTARLVRLQPRCIFRDSITRLLGSLHTLRAALSGRRRNVRFRLAASLCRAGFLSRWVPVLNFSVFTSFRSGPSFNRLFLGATCSCSFP